MPEGRGHWRQRRSGDARGEGRADGPDPAHLVASPCLGGFLPPTYERFFIAVPLLTLGIP